MANIRGDEATRDASSAASDSIESSGVTGAVLPWTHVARKRWRCILLEAHASSLPRRYTPDYTLSCAHRCHLPKSEPPYSGTVCCRRTVRPLAGRQPPTERHPQDPKILPLSFHFPVPPPPFYLRPLCPRWKKIYKKYTRAGGDSIHFPWTVCFWLGFSCCEFREYTVRKVMGGAPCAPSPLCFPPSQLPHFSLCRRLRAIFPRHQRRKARPDRTPRALYKPTGRVLVLHASSPPLDRSNARSISIRPPPNATIVVRGWPVVLVSRPFFLFAGVLFPHLRSLSDGALLYNFRLHLPLSL